MISRLCHKLLLRWCLSIKKIKLLLLRYRYIEFPHKKITDLRYDLIREELDELKDAIEKKNIKEVADALTDILYVTYGAGHAFGIDLDKCFQEVQSSNMSKLGLDGKPIYNDKGKVMKGPNYFKPELTKFVA